MYKTDILLITPPFSQLNTAYPASMQLKGYLDSQGFTAAQSDLSIKTINKLFSTKGLTKLFSEAGKSIQTFNPNTQRIYANRNEYIRFIEPVIAFLQAKNPTLAYSVAQKQILPEASRFQNIDELEWAFGNLGIADQAKYICTLFLEDLGDFIADAIDPHFGFSRYAERIALSANSFDQLYSASNEHTLVSDFAFECLAEQIEKHQPLSIGISVPFPGNLLSALQLARFIKSKYTLPVIFGGGYINTELRSFSDTRIFEFADFICLDDGERPLQTILEYLKNTRPIENLCRTFIQKDGLPYFINGDQIAVQHSEINAPSYEGICPTEYISTLEILNPMHRLWSDGWWNKLMLSHGCYWQQCSFCDTSLDYIKRISKASAAEICDRIESVIAQTGQTGFHFVDEAAPPAVLRDLAIELLKRNIHISWWGNIRFEKSFTADVCHLLAESGCIGVSGGLEVASDRLLALINKGVSIEQVAQVCNNFTQSGIMSHAYLMYGFPTETAQETIDSLEIVRQLFEAGIIQSAFWHQFAMTVHSPIGQEPSKFHVEATDPAPKPFANNDLQHTDPKGADHQKFSAGLKKALYNYMHGVGFEFSHQEWFDFRVPSTSLPPNIINFYLRNKQKLPANGRMLWIGSLPQVWQLKKKTKKGKLPQLQFSFITKTDAFDVVTDLATGTFLINQLKKMQVHSDHKLLLKEFQELATQDGISYTKLINQQIWHVLRENGLLIL